MSKPTREVMSAENLEQAYLGANLDEFYNDGEWDEADDEQAPQPEDPA